MQHGPKHAAFLAVLIGMTFPLTGYGADAFVDSFDDGDVSDWRDVASAGSTMTHRLSGSRAMNGATSMKMTYSVATGGYASLEKVFSSRPNWSTATGLQVWMYGAGTNDRFTVQVSDAGGERWKASVAVGWYGWQRVTFPFSSFQKTSWQASGTTQNSTFDRDGVQSLSLIPSSRPGFGQMYLDALVATTSSSTAVVPAPPATTSSSAGTIVPLYSYPTNPTWTELIAHKAANPTVPVLAVVNPSNGPGSGVDLNYAAGIKRLVNSGIKVIAYVYTAYASRPLAQAQADIERWRAYYPEVTGIFFDEQAHFPGYEGYYKTLTEYGRARGFDFTIGNPGADSVPSYIGTVDVILIYESDGLPSLTRLAGWHAQYDKKNFGIIPYAVSTLDSAFIASARQAVGYIFVQNDVMPNPWDTLPSHFRTLMGLLR